MKSNTSADTVILTDQQGRGELRVIFDNVDTAILHSYYLCKERNCGELQDKFHSDKSKFTHSWLYSKELSFIETCGLWSLIDKENDGMFCLLCRKHNTRNLRNNSDTWNATPSIRFQRSSVVEHFATKQHKDAVQRVSSFQKEYEEKRDLNDAMLEKAFTAVYWIAKEEIANVKLVSLLQLFENLGVSELSQRSRPAVREMFLIVGEVLKEHYLEKIRKVDSCGLLADETSDVYVLEQLIMFVKFVDYELGEPRTVFLSAECITDPSGPNAEVLTESILGVLKEFNLNINKMKSFVSDGATVMTGIHNGVVAMLKRVNNVMLNFHCICHRLALACCDSGNETEYVKGVEGILTQVWKFF